MEARTESGWYPLGCRQTSTTSSKALIRHEASKIMHSQAYKQQSRTQHQLDVFEVKNTCCHVPEIKHLIRFRFSRNIYAFILVLCLCPNIVHLLTVRKLRTCGSRNKFIFKLIHQPQSLYLSSRKMKRLD